MGFALGGFTQHPGAGREHLGSPRSEDLPSVALNTERAGPSIIDISVSNHSLHVA